MQYTTLSNFKFKYNRVTVQFSCLINKKKNMTLHCRTFLRTSIFINFITNLHEFYFSFFICLFVTGTIFFSFITLVWGKYKQLNSVKHRMPYVLIESACCRIQSKKNWKFYIKTEQKIIICKVKFKSNVIISWLLCNTDFVNMNSAERLDLLQLQN